MPHPLQVDVHSPEELSVLAQNGDVTEQKAVVIGSRIRERDKKNAENYVGDYFSALFFREIVIFVQYRSATTTAAALFPAIQNHNKSQVAVCLMSLQVTKFEGGCRIGLGGANFQFKPPGVIFKSKNVEKNFERNRKEIELHCKQGQICYPGIPFSLSLSLSQAICITSLFKTKFDLLKQSFCAQRPSHLQSHSLEQKLIHLHKKEDVFFSQTDQLSKFFLMPYSTNTRVHKLPTPFRWNFSCS